jgi:hypothetical protein
MNIEVRILLIPIDEHDRRGFAEKIESNVYFSSELSTAIPNDVNVFSLTDFMDLCNNQEIDLEQYWVSYIWVRNDEK